MRLKDKVAVITGAATGIGRASAVLFGREGARVVIGDVNDAEAEETLRQARAAGAEIDYVHCDVSRTADVDALARAAVDRYGRLDVMFNNAGRNFFGKVHETTDETWDACLSLNLGGIFRGMRAALPHMLNQGGGSIINTASIQAIVAFNNFAAYEAAKGGIVALTRQAALDYAPHNIRVNCICPGAVRTPMNPEMWDPSLDGGVRLKRSSERTPLLRVGEAEDIAYAALYFASDESSWTTGQYFLVDGGLAIKGS
ncbi:MAG: SDR family oxidoreductase [Chloroflexota bacterium]|nr:SDR family oxidoreductase [Chloroflexota bacterium]